MPRAISLTIVLLSFLALSACGQKATLVAPNDLDGTKAKAETGENKPKTSGILLD